jgi:GlpG protein
MRQIGRLNNESNARVFGDYLTCLEIRNSIESDSDGSWSVWVHSEDQLDAGNKALAEFLANPKDAKYQQSIEKAAAIRKKIEKEETDFAKRVVTPDKMWPQFGLGPLTLVLIVACAGVVAMGRGFPLTEENYPFYSKLLISTLLSPDHILPEVRHGEIWRLITPAFIHWSWMHIIFNMLWLKDLGSMIEARKGSLTLLLLVVVIAAVSNYAQFLVSGPVFGGMSGVIYGLFGYVWMRGRYDPASGLRLHPTNVILMIGWFFLCLANLPIMPHIANMCHGSGLVLGMIWGAAPPLLGKLFK